MSTREESSLSYFETKKVTNVEKCDRFPPPYINPFLRLLIYLIIIGLTGNPFMGWTGIQELLYKSGAFEDLCIQSNETTIEIRSSFFTDCAERKESINGLYSIAFSVNIFFCIFSGFILDFFGQKISFIFGHLANFLVWIFWGIFPKNGTLIRFLFFIIGITAESMYLPLTTVSLYFPGYKSLILAILGAFRTISFYIPSILSRIYLSPKIKKESFYLVAIGYSFVGYLGSCVIVSFIIQRKFFDKSHNSEKTTEKSLEDNENNKIPFPVLVERGFENLKNFVNHKQFLELILFTIASSFHMASVQFLIKAQREIFVTTQGKSAIEMFRYSQVMTLIPEIIVGYIVDKIGSIPSYLIVQSFMFLTCLVSGFDNYIAKVSSCFLYTIGGTLFLSLIIFYIYENYPPEKLGVTLGFVLFFCGLMITSNIPLYKSLLGYNRKEGSFLKISCILIGYMSVSIISNLGVLHLKTRTKHPRLEKDNYNTN